LVPPSANQSDWSAVISACTGDDSCRSDQVEELAVLVEHLEAAMTAVDDEEAPSLLI